VDPVLALADEDVLKRRVLIDGHRSLRVGTVRTRRP
jgi:hypothetical protein